MHWRAMTAALNMFILTVTLALAGEIKPFQPAPTAKCPVCGMFVAKYPDWLAQITFKDGTLAYFDGVKDLMKYYFDLPKYNPAKKTSDIAAVYVTDYYSLKILDGFKALYVVGSDVYGPMGRELIPFAEEAAAREFMRDHGGKALLKFGDINPDLIKALD